jgi:MFS transporter, ACS family, D-galactonate transporter
MFALRLVLGIGESIAYPSYSRILANYFPEHHRGMANAMIDAGTKLGPAMGTLIGGLLMAIYGWRAFFVVLGASSLIWLIPWILWMPRGEGAETHHVAEVMPSAGQILRHRAAIFSALGLFCSNYFWYFLLTWLPYYLQSARHFTAGRMATTAASAYFSIALSTIIAGHLSDRWIQDSGAATVFLLLACFSFGIYTANVFAITQTLAGPRAAGKWTSLQNGFANLAGVAAPWLTGFIVQQTGEYFWAFAVAAVVVLTGAAIFIFGIGRLEPVKWAKPTGVSFPEALDA